MKDSGNKISLSVGDVRGTWREGSLTGDPGGKAPFPGT